MDILRTKEYLRKRGPDHFVIGDNVLDPLVTISGRHILVDEISITTNETVAYSTALQGGSKNYTINFPKTFGSIPSISVTLQNDEGGPSIPFITSGVSTTGYSINFESTVPDDNYKIHTFVQGST